MKQFKFLIFAFVLMGSVVGFSSCGDEEEPDPNLVGMWTVDSIEASIDSTVNDANGSGTMTFNSDKTGSRNYSFTTLGNPFTINDTFTWDDSTDGTLSITLSNNGIETWTRTVDTSTAQEMSVQLNINSISTNLRFTLSK